jgi:hypothetical protein
MKYRKTSYKASVEFFFVTFSYGNITSCVPEKVVDLTHTTHLDTRGGTVAVARDTFLSQSIMCRYILTPISGRKYCFSSLKDRKKNLSHAMKRRGNYTIRMFLSQTDPDFMPIDLQKFWIK